MLSNKLTFSLASLVLLLMIALCLPVGAQQITDTTVVVLPATGTSTVRLNDANAAETVASSLPQDGFVVYSAAADVGIVSSVDATTAFGSFDLEEFFRLGGTLKLIAPTSVGLKKYELVISEIMWALDVDNPGDTATANDRRQWIEIYNNLEASTPALPEGTLKLVFKPFMHEKAAGTTIPATEGIGATAAPGTGVDGVAHIVLDSVSNMQYGRWDLPGQNGNTTAPALNPLDPPLKPLISAYRNIDYTKGKAAGVPDGDVPGNWKATPALGSRGTGSTTVPRELIIGTPGTEHVKDIVHAGVSKTSIPSNSVVINEVRNDTSPENVDWVELYNAGTTAVDLHGWELSLIDATHAPTADDSDKHAKTDTILVGKEDGGSDADRFPRGADWRLGAKEYLLIVNRHPRNTSIANGINIDEVIDGKEVKAGAMHQYIVREKLNLPSANITLLLRNNLEKNASHKGVDSDDAKKRALTDTAPSANLMDYAGNVSFEVRTNEYNTLVWPFKGWSKTAATDGKDGEAIPNNQTQSHARKRYQANDGHHKDAWDQVGHKGGLGYDPGVDLRFAPGTPGYPNDSIKNALVDDKNTSDTADDVVFDGEISISEIMYDAGPRWNLIQWIELYNSSMTEAVNLKDWEMEIHNATSDVEAYVDNSFTFNDLYILPNQTVLIVSGGATNDVKENKVYNLYQHHRSRLGLTNRRSTLFSPDGFYIQLKDKNGDMVDEAGNLTIGLRERTVLWPLPDRNLEMRQSLVRQYGTRELYDGSADPKDDGTMMESWRQSDIAGAGISFYGHRDDVGTPGYRLGGPLPVELSSFRPVRNETTGHVDITWVTQSELNNAGFNVLRSESKTGEFKVVNVKGIIAGHGTTSEKHVYTFTDTTAKPNVVYYYQIEDVSLDGNRTTLATTHLRGNVTAAGKVTTTWGDLKTQN